MTILLSLIAAASVYAIAYALRGILSTQTKADGVIHKQDEMWRKW